MFSPTQVKIPATSAANKIVSAARDVVQALHNPSPASPLVPISNSNTAALKQIYGIFFPPTDPKAPSTATNNIPVVVQRVLIEPTPFPRVTPKEPPGFEPIHKPNNPTINTNTYTERTATQYNDYNSRNEQKPSKYHHLNQNHPVPRYLVRRKKCQGLIILISIGRTDLLCGR